MGLISDIHSNLPAFQAVLSALKRLGVSRILCAGDLVGYYSFPNEVVGLAERAGVHSIAGNHERAILEEDYSNMNEMAARAARWTAGRLDAASRASLRRLPRRDRLEVSGRLVMLVHGSPRDDDEYVYPPASGAWPFGGLDVDILVMGHTHVQWQGRFGGLLAVNPGSVGQPRDGNRRAAFATLDTRDLSVRLLRADYDRKPVTAGITACGLPAHLAERLEAGF